MRTNRAESGVTKNPARWKSATSGNRPNWTRSAGSTVSPTSSLTRNRLVSAARQGTASAVSRRAKAGLRCIVPPLSDAVVFPDGAFRQVPEGPGRLLCRHTGKAIIYLESQDEIPEPPLLLSLAQSAVLEREVRFGSSRLELRRADGYDVVLGKDMDVTDTPGAPQLPVQAVVVVLPGRCRVTGVTFEPAGWQPLSSSYRVYPAQRQSVLMAENPVQSFTAPDVSIYQSSSPWPASAARWTGTGYSRESTFVQALVYPVRYSGATGTVGDLFAGQRASGVRTGNRAEFTVWRRIRVCHRDRRRATIRCSSAWPTGRRRRACRPWCATIGWVTSNYPGRDDAEKLRNYLKTVPDSGAKYVLLGGDVARGAVPHGLRDELRVGRAAPARGLAALRPLLRRPRRYVGREQQRRLRRGGRLNRPVRRSWRRPRPGEQCRAGADVRAQGASTTSAGVVPGSRTRVCSSPRFSGRTRTPTRACTRTGWSSSRSPRATITDQALPEPGQRDARER